PDGGEKGILLRGQEAGLTQDGLLIEEWGIPRPSLIIRWRCRASRDEDCRQEDEEHAAAHHRRRITRRVSQKQDESAQGGSGLSPVGWMSGENPRRNVCSLITEADMNWIR